MNGEQSQNSILSGPECYTVTGRDIKNVQVQEADLLRLQDHIWGIKELSIRIDCFNLFLGAAISSFFTIIIQWVSTKSAPVPYLIVLIISLVATLCSYAYQVNKMDLSHAQHLLTEARNDLETIFIKAKLEEKSVSYKKTDKATD